MDAAGEYVLFHMQMEGKERKKKKEERRKNCIQQKFKDFLAVKMFKHL
jgi:hypothetical protein